MSAYLADRGPYLLVVALVVINVYILLAHRNLLKAIVGLSLFQSAVILFFILLSVVREGTIPIRGAAGDPALANPLPHALMLTAIVVGVATLGVALAILRRIQSESGSIEEGETRAEEQE